MSHKTAMMFSDSKVSCLRGGTVDASTSIKAVKPADSTLTIAALSQSTTYPVFGSISTERQLRALHMSEPIVKGSEKSNPSGASFPVHRTELSSTYYKMHYPAAQSSIII